VAQFSLTVPKSTGAGRAEESTCHLWNLFRWRFPSCHGLSFCCLFLSQQGLRALPNPRVSFGWFLGDDFWVGSELVFVDYFWVKRGCWRLQIHASPLESVSLMISETVVAKFPFTVSKSTGAGRADESRRHLWKLFRWRFRSRYRLRFRWPFFSQHGLRALPIPHLTFGRFLGDDFWVGNESLFVDYLWVNRGCGRWGIHSSTSESVSLTILETVVA